VYTWAFGDGTTAGGTPASHAYDHGGLYGVTLTIANDKQIATVTQAISVAAPTSRRRGAGH
jgi:PKD repeat protein